MNEFTRKELEALLERPVRRLISPTDRDAFAGQRVLITGAGGSIGSELARQIARCRPSRLTLVEQSELNLFQVERELSEVAPHVAIEPILADITRRDVMRRVVADAEPQIVYHAAAYKHVTMVERAVCAALAVNVIGTVNVADAARDANARFVLISSDKAAMPRSVMGATKRLAELAVIAMARPTFRPIVVRFGNVLGSSGSVLTVLRDCIRRGRPVPVTDPRATRYFMTADEAVSLVMKADLLARRAETYWLDMGEPVAIGDLVKRLMQVEAEAGFAAVPVRITGLKPGEKLREELTTQGLRMCRTSHSRIWVARQPRVAGDVIGRQVKRIERLIARGRALEALDVLAAAVPEFVVSNEASSAARTQSERRRAAGLGLQRRTA